MQVRLSRCLQITGQDVVFCLHKTHFDSDADNSPLLFPPPTSIPSGRTSHPSGASASAPLPGSGREINPAHITGSFLTSLSLSQECCCFVFFSALSLCHCILCLGSGGPVQTVVCRWTWHLTLGHVAVCQNLETALNPIPRVRRVKSYLWESKTWNRVAGPYLSIPTKYPGSHGPALSTCCHRWFLKSVDRKHCPCVN